MEGLKVGNPPVSKLGLIMLGVVALLAVPDASAQTVVGSRWRFGDGGNGDLAAEISTEVGHGFVVSLTFQCNERGRYSLITHHTSAFPVTDEHNDYIDSFVDGDLHIETYAGGLRTDRFRPTGFHAGDGDEVTDSRLESMRRSQFILITGGARPIALPSTNASIALAQYAAACAVLQPNRR